MAVLILRKKSLTVQARPRLLWQEKNHFETASLFEMYTYPPTTVAEMTSICGNGHSSWTLILLACSLTASSGGCSGQGNFQDDRRLPIALLCTATCDRHAHESLHGTSKLILCDFPASPYQLLLVN